MHDELNTVEVSYQPIELCKLLKIANMVGGGGEAKIVISEGYVYLNQEVEFQKRKKVYHQDVVEFNGEIIQVICHEPVTDPSIIKQQKIAEKIHKEKLALKQSKKARKTIKKKSNRHNKSEAVETDSTEDRPANTGGRRRISF